MINRISNRPGARFPKVPKTFRARKAIRKTPTHLFCKARLSQGEKGIMIKITAKFRASRRLRFEDTKRIMSAEMRLKSLGTFKKRPKTTFFCFRWTDLTGNATQESQNQFFASLTETKRLRKRCQSFFLILSLYKPPNTAQEQNCLISHQVFE